MRRGVRDEDRPGDPVSGTTAVAAKLQNYRGASSKFRSVSEGAVKAALPRLAEITPPGT